MQKSITLAVTLGLAAFVIFWPMGFPHAVFAGLASLIFGAWTRGSGLPLGLFYLAASLAMGLMCVVMACIGAAPGAGTFVFGAETASLVFNIPRYGAETARFSGWTFAFVVLPPAAGMLLGHWAERHARAGSDVVSTTPAD